MKILVLSDDFPPEVAGGAGMMAFRISKEFINKGHDVLVIASTSDKRKEGKSAFEGISVINFYSAYHERWRAYVSVWNPFFLFKLKKIIVNFKPDVVHAHNVHGRISYASLLLARKYSSKVFMTAHDIMSFYPGTFTEFIDKKALACPTRFDYRVSSIEIFKKFRYRYNPFRNSLIRFCLRKLNKIVAVSDALKDALVQNGIKNIEVIRNGIDTEYWKSPPGGYADGESDVSMQGFRRKFNCENSKIVLFGGRLSGAKGGDLILDAMNKIFKIDRKAKLLIVGQKNDYALKLEKKARDLGISDKVVFAGWLDESEMKQAYAASSLVVVPSVCFDSFPNGNLEAFASGKPVVATCFGGSSEIVKNNENGFIVNPFDVDSMFKVINDLLVDEDKAKKFGESGRKLIIQNYSIQSVAAEYLKLFSDFF